MSGSSSAVERQLPKLDVAGSIPVSRSNFSDTFKRISDGGLTESLIDVPGFHFCKAWALHSEVEVGIHAALLVLKRFAGDRNHKC